MIRTGTLTRWKHLGLGLASVALALSPLVVRAQALPQRTATALPGERTFAGVSEAHILEAIRTARIVGRQQVGSTSVNLHLHLAGDVDAAFKPRTVSNADAYRAEIAAYRLNRLLGLQRVPPAISRAVAASALHLSATTPVTIERDGTVHGAAIYWIPVLRESRIDQAREQQRWSGWLRAGSTIPPDQLTRAEEISTLIVFDVLTGNWDRWSGQNVPMDAAGHLVYRDNNGAFSEPFGDRMLAGVMRHVRLVQRFSRGLIRRARALTDASVRGEMALDPDAARPPLTPVQITSLLRRRDAVMAYIDDQVRRHGDAAVYAFP